MNEQPPENSSMFKQPKAVWAVAFACVISFMGIGLVDPILPAIAQQLHASPSQVSLLFTSYLLVTGFAMLLSGAVSSRIGAKLTLISGLILIIVFAGLGGLSHSISQLVGFRGGWGLGNAMFISTALAVIVSVASGGSAKAIILYEAALGLGISVGPLAGGEPWHDIVESAVFRCIGFNGRCSFGHLFSFAACPKAAEENFRQCADQSASL